MGDFEACILSLHTFPLSLLCLCLSFSLFPSLPPSLLCCHQVSNFAAIHLPHHDIWFTTDTKTMETSNYGLKPLKPQAKIYIFLILIFQTFCHSNRNLSNRNWCQEMELLLWLYLIMWFKGLCEWFWGGICKSLKNQPRERLECSKQSLVSISDVCLEDQIDYSWECRKWRPCLWSFRYKWGLYWWTRDH